MSALTEVCQALDGSVGCGFASDQDLSILLNGLENQVVSVRDGCLRSLRTLVTFVDPESERFVKRLWVAKFDIVAENRKLADTLWEDAGLEDHGHKSLAEDLLKVYTVVGHHRLGHSF